MAVVKPLIAVAHEHLTLRAKPTFRFHIGANHSMEALDVEYVIVGSAASTVHEVVCSTVDTDIIADFARKNVEPM